MNPMKKQIVKSGLTVTGIIFYIQICNSREDAYAIIQDASFRSLISLKQQEKLLVYADALKKKMGSSNSTTKIISLNDGIKRTQYNEEHTLKYAAFISTKLIVTLIIIAIIIIVGLVIFL